MKLFKHYYGKKGLMIEALKPARGVEKRYRDSFKQEPFSRLETRKSISEPAKLLRKAQAGDGEAVKDFARYLSVLINKHSRMHGWKNMDKKREVILAWLAIYPFVSVGRVSMKDRQSAKKLGISVSSFHESWKPKIQLISSWVDRWADELSG